MEMCPYCGEEVPDESARCWKCGAILQEIDDETAAEVEAELAAEAPPKLEACPHCGSRQKIGTHRCKECGRVINAFEEGESQDKWKYGSWVAFGGVGLIIVMILSIAVLTGESNQRRVYVPQGSWAAFGQRYSEKSIKARARQVAEKWEREHKDRFVVWSGKVVSIDGLDVEFAMSPAAKEANKAEVKVSFSDSAEGYVESLAKGKEVRYDARLVAYDQEGYRLILEDGVDPDAE